MSPMNTRVIFAAALLVCTATSTAASSADATDATAATATTDAIKATDATDDGNRKFSIAVMDLTVGRGVDRELVEAVGGALTQALEALGVFEAISTGEIRQMIRVEAMKQSVADCGTMSCMAEIAGALGAQFTVFGSLLKVDDIFLLQLRLIDTVRARAINRVQREYTGGPAGLFDGARDAIKMLVRDLLALKSGNLHLVVSEVGASVKVDGVIIGVSPIDSFQISGGLHTIAVEKEDFVRFTKDVEIKEKQTAQLVVHLQPSEDYKTNYVASANRMRALAWSGIGLGGAGIIASVAMAAYSGSATAGLNADIRTYNQTNNQQTSQAYAALQGRAGDLRAINAVTWIVGVIGVGALATGILAYLYGDSPDHFDTSATVSTGVEALSIGPLVTPHGFAATVEGRF